MNCHVIVIATKADKIPKGKWQKHLKITRETLGLAKEDELLLFSSETGEGKDQGVGSIKEIYVSRKWNCSISRWNRHRAFFFMSTLESFMVHMVYMTKN